MYTSAFVVMRLARNALVALATILPSVSGIAAQGTLARAAPTRANGEIRGRVVSVEGKRPIAGARVEVRGDGTPDSLAHAVSASSGNFHVQGLRPGTYRLRITAIGFVPRELTTVAVGAVAPTIDVGTVALTVSAVKLSSVEVRDRKADVDLAPDRNAYVVKEMPTTRGGTALDVLRNVPSVDVDIDNIVSLRGNPGVIVQLNGRPSPMKAGQLGNFLAQLPADIVDRVEIVSNPSGREDPTGVAGIINIVLKKKAEAGTSGGVTIGGVTTGMQNIGVNLGYDRGPLSLYGSYGLTNDRRTRNDWVARENLYVVPTTLLDEYGSRTQQPLMHTIAGSANYALGKHDELSSDLLFSTRVEPEQYALRFTNMSAARIVTSLTDRRTDGTNHENSLEATVGYKHAFAEKGHKLTAEFRFDQGLEGGPTTVDAQALVSYVAPMDVEQGHNASRARVSFAARKKFLDDQLSVTVRVLDPFSTSMERSTTIDPRFTQLSDRMRAIRGLGLSVSWTFGKPDKEHSPNDLIGEPPAA